MKGATILKSPPYYMEALPSIVKLAPRLEPSPKKGAGLKKEKTLTSEGASLMEGATMERAHAKFDEGAKVERAPRQNGGKR